MIGNAAAVCCSCSLVVWGVARGAEVLLNGGGGLSADCCEVGALIAATTLAKVSLLLSSLVEATGSDVGPV